ncbi:MAG: hemerythrin domain-containing protein [Candidatus Dormibacteria bacterium]
MNAITVLKDDHKRIKELFRRYERLGNGARKSKQRLVEQMTRELAEHSSIEETVFYPECRSRVPDADGDVLESLEEHHIVKWTLDELSKSTPADERYDAKVRVLMENVRHHIDEEEHELFPEVARQLTRRELSEIGESLQAARAIAPTRPHPRAPDEPPGNLVATIASTPLDIARDRVEAAVGALTGSER